MAEIKIQPRKPSPWSYVLYGVALAAVVFLVYRNFQHKNNPLQTESVQVDTSKVAGSVQAFLAFVNGETSEETGSPAGNENSPQYSPYGLQLLAAAIGAMVSRDEPADRDLLDKSKNLMQLSDSINETWDTAVPAETLKTALLSASDIMSNLQSRHYPGLKEASDNARRTAESLIPDRKAADQVAVIRNFYEQSGEILKNMAHSKRNAKV